MLSTPSWLNCQQQRCRRHRDGNGNDTLPIKLFPPPPGRLPRAQRTALHPSTAVPLPAFLFLSGIVLFLEMASYGKWLFNQTRSLSRANPSYQLAVVGNFLLASLGTQVCVTSRLVAFCCCLVLVVVVVVEVVVVVVVAAAVAEHLGPSTA